MSKEDVISLLQVLNNIRENYGDEYVSIKDLFENTTDIILRDIAADESIQAYVDVIMSNVPRIRINQNGIDFLNRFSDVG